MEKGEFEKKWGDAFEGAEVSPSDSVWTNIELDLERAAGSKMKRRMLFYKLLAAASLVFAMGIGAVYYLQVTPEGNKNSLATQHETQGVEESPEKPVAANTESNPFGDSEISSAAPGLSATIDNFQADNEPLLADANRSDRVRIEHQSSTESQSRTEHKSPGLQAANHQQNKTPGNENDRGNNALAEQNIASTLDDSGVRNDQTIGKANQELVAMDDNKILDNRKLPPLTLLKNPELIIAKKENESTADPGMVLLAKLRDEEMKYEKEEKKKSQREELWTSVAFGAGTFSPNAGSSSMIQASDIHGLSSSHVNSPSSGSSYSFGVQLGGKIANRVVLVGGVSYLTQNASYMSNIASMESMNLKAELNDMAYFSTNNRAVTTSPYNVSSNLQYISVPTQIGYVVVDRKFAIQLNGGVSSDIFILNTLTPDAADVSKSSQGPGNDSPYRPVLFSGLAGTEFSYRFSDKYRVALNPGVRYALNSMYKDGVSTEASPITYDVAIRFRYIFK
ncbi:MAG: hypothetical protein KF845_08410 [Cyclobacteriaceae bacterium]|nr:hypothetical protein [Cyclobacteriaceae bacterium]